MNENRNALMERIDRIFVERVRSAATSEKRGVGALVDAYRYLKTVTLKGWEVRLLSRFRDPLAAALACWKRKADRAVFDIRALLAEIAREAELFRTWPESGAFAFSRGRSFPGNSASA